MYSDYEEARKRKGLTNAAVSKATGIPQPTLSDWKHGRYTPKRDKLIKIAELLEVPVEFLADGTMPTEYYFNEATAKTAQEIFESPELRLLFDAARDSDPDDLLYVRDLLLKLKRAERK